MKQRIVAEGTPAAMTEQSTFGAQVIEIDCTPLDKALTALRESKLFAEVALYGSTIHAMGTNAAERIAATRARLQTNGVTVTRVETIAPSLEDVFIARLRSADKQN